MQGKHPPVADCDASSFACPLLDMGGRRDAGEFPVRVTWEVPVSVVRGEQIARRLMTMMIAVIWVTNGCTTHRNEARVTVALMIPKICLDLTQNRTRTQNS